MAKQGQIPQIAIVLITLGFMTFGVWHERDIGIVGAETTAVVLITHGFMTFGVWHERDSGKAGADTTYSYCSHYAWVYDLQSLARARFWRFSQTREAKVIKSEERFLILLSNVG